MTEPLLAIDDLTIDLAGPRGRAHVVDGLSLELARGETLCLVGESGCGKSVTALAVLRLLEPPLAIAGGQVRFGGLDLLSCSARELRAVRGARIAMVFQEPMTALNPVLSVGDQVAEALLVHRAASSRREARRRVVALFEEVRLPDAARRYDEYPHRLSGGMRQRVLIAMALACGPEVLLLDEPTTALDVTVQAEILDLLREIQARRGTALLLITHDLGIVAEMAHRVAVMYAGRIVEEAGVERLFAAPAHPYTRGLFRSRPAGAERGRLVPIEGSVPAPFDWPSGCRFHPRCPEAEARCGAEDPRLAPVGGGNRAACLVRQAAAAAEGVR